MDELDKLDQFLDSDDSPDECMALSDFDGFLHGVACTPEPIDEWREIAFGASDGIPDEILRIAIARLEDIRERLANGGTAEPVFWQAKEGHVIAMDWCEGFMDAVNARHDVWDRFSQTPNGAKLMLPILAHMIDEQGNSMLGIAQEDLDETLDVAAEAIPEIVPAVYQEIRNVFPKSVS